MSGPRIRVLRVAMTAVALLLLSSSCTNHVQPHLKLPALQLGEPSFRTTMVAYTGSAVVPGNRVDILLNGDEIFPAKLAAIRAARKTIPYAQYVFVSV